MKIHWFLQVICSNFRCLPNHLGYPSWRSFLSTPIVDPVTLQTYIATIEDQLIVDTNYEPVFKDIYEFYAHKLVMFTNFEGMLLLQLPVPIKLKWKYLCHYIQLTLFQYQWMQKLMKVRITNIAWLRWNTNTWQ